LHHQDAKITTQEDEKQLEDIRDNEFLQPLSSRPLSSSPRSDGPLSSVKEEEQSTTTAPPMRTASTKVQTFKDAKQSRDTAKPSRVGGGIFRSSGNHTIITRNEEILRPAPVITSPPATVDATVHKAPMTLFNFTKMWESNMKDEDRWNLFSGIPPLSLPKMFQASLDPALLSSMLQHFERVIDQQIAVPSDVREYMVSLSRVQRFGTIMLFMSKDEKILLNRLWEKCGKLDS